MAIPSLYGITELVERVNDPQAKQEMLDDYYRQYMMLLELALEQKRKEAKNVWTKKSWK